MVDHDPSNQKVKDTYKECKSLVRKIVASVFGEEYKISKTESSKRASDHRLKMILAGKNVSSKMKKCWNYGKNKSGGQGGSGKDLFSVKTSMKKFRASRWNNVAQRSNVLEKIGDNKRDSKYYLKK